jgi:hypothetical protein
MPSGRLWLAIQKELYMKSMKYLLLLAVLGGFSTLHAEEPTTDAPEEVVIVEDTTASDAE